MRVPASSLRAGVAVALVALGMALDVGHCAAADGQGQTHAEATRHFKSGVKLYQEGNFTGALAEFEEAYREHPTWGALQNVALCQRALFRYAEAAVTLEKLLVTHAADLDDKAKSEVQRTIDELAALTGTVKLVPKPADARLSVDGRALEGSDRGQALRLNVGEHTLVAEAPGYQRWTRVIRVASRSTSTLEIPLVATMGFAEVTVDDADAAIAIDGVAKAFKTWRGALDPGRHYVQVYKSGRAPFEQAFTIAVGATEQIHATLGPPTAQDTPPAKAQRSEPTLAPVRGWYGLFALDLLDLRTAPAGLTHDPDKPGRGAQVGVRAGYRLWTPVGAELQLGWGTYTVDAACIGDTCGNARQAYELGTFRVGGNLRVMSSGQQLRFTSTVGVGAARHELAVKEFDGDAAAAGALAPYSARGVDPYFQFDIGAQMNLGHWLAELTLDVHFDGAGRVRGTDGAGKAVAPYENAGGLTTAGIGLRFGWGEWTDRTPTQNGPSPGAK